MVGKRSFTLRDDDFIFSSMACALAELLRRDGGTSEASAIDKDSL